MPYTELTLKPGYESGIDDLVQDFYVPVLECTMFYDRIAGFFSSSSLAIAARGIAGLVQNRGKMRLLASPRLSAEDALIIADVTHGGQHFLQEKLLNEIDHITDEFERDHLQALGWMLTNGYLEIRLVQVVDKNDVVLQNNLFHQKVGVLEDIEGNRLSFSGSINESASGWLNNVEEFKVFRQWVSGQTEFFQTDATRFAEFWNGYRSNVNVFELPQAVKEHLIKCSEDFSIDQFIARHYVKKQKSKNVGDKLSLFAYQQTAVQSWIDNGCTQLFEMATGTGKTRTALACVNYVFQKEDKLVVIIACPQTTLSYQWKDNEIEPAGLIFDFSIIVDGTNNWRKQLPLVFKKVSAGFYKKVVVYTTHSTCSCDDFVELIMRNSTAFSICFVGDEAHGLGSSKNKRALLECYRYRIGLSATPQRWFDDYGTEALKRYFGDKSFEFTIADALSTINPITNRAFLVNYNYKPVFISLTEAELESYKKLSNKIKKLSAFAKTSDEYQERYEALLFARANIQKNAANKLSALVKVLQSIEHIKNTLLFVSDAQINQVIQILLDLNITAHRFTEKQGTTPKPDFGGLSERQFLLKHFKENDYQALVAINCLNEGIDMPSADTAILMANSTNPREYIQRIGRVIRQAPNKGNAHIYDFIVEPDQNVDFSPEVQAFEKKVFEKELLRAREMAQNAINNAQICVILDQKIWEVKDYGIE